MKYGPRSKLRRACSRFLRFAYLLDFVALDALRNIFIGSVEFTLEKLEQLSGTYVSYDLVAASSQVGGKGLVSSKYAPLFAVAAKFLGNERPRIPEELLLTDKIPRFETAFGQQGKKEDFDPTVHLELKEPELASDEEEDAPEAEEDEESGLVVRTRVRDIHVAWLQVEPSRKSFTLLLHQCF